MSIVQVAQLAGVSKSTVSRVINDLPGVAPDAAQAVRQAMGQIGYQPSARRPGPKSANRKGLRTGNVALLMMGYKPSDFTHMPVLPAMMHGAERELAANGMSLVVATFGPEGPVPAALTGMSVDGMLLLGKWPNMPEESYKLLQRRPAVWALREHTDPDGYFDHVFYDNAAVAHLAASYLLKRGHKHVGFVNARPGHTAFAQRGVEFAAAIKKAGADVKLAIEPGNNDDPNPVACEKLVNHLMDSAQPPTALFVPADRELAAVYRALEARGLKPCEDIDIVSVDNEQHHLVTLSARPATIDINLELVGRRAVQQLLWRIQNPDQPSRVDVLIRPVLVAPTK